MEENPVTASPAPAPSAASVSGASASATSASAVSDTDEKTASATKAKEVAVSEATATEATEEIASTSENVLSPLPDEAIEVAKKIAESQNVLVALSSDPSVDEMAAALGLAIFLDKLGKRATAIYSGKTPNALEFLKPDETFETSADVLQDFVIALNKDKADHLRYKLDGDYVKIYITPYKSKVSKEDLTFSYGDYNVDLVLALDVANGVDLDSALREHGRIMHDAVIVDITTGNPGKLGEIEWSDKSASSVSEMAAKLLYGVSKDKIEKDEATAFLTGIVAATNRFSNAKTTPETMQISSLLMRSGANQQLVSKNITPDVDNELAEQVNLDGDKPKTEADVTEQINLDGDKSKTEMASAKPEVETTSDEPEVEAASVESEVEAASAKPEVETASAKDEDKTAVEETEEKTDDEKIEEKAAASETVEETAEVANGEEAETETEASQEPTGDEIVQEPAEEEVDPTQLSVTHEKKTDTDEKLEEPAEKADEAETLAPETQNDEPEKTEMVEESQIEESEKAESLEGSKAGTQEETKTETPAESKAETPAESKAETPEESKAETPAEEPDSPELLDDLKKAAEGLSNAGDLETDTKTEEESSSGFLEVSEEGKAEAGADASGSDQGPTPEEEGLMRAGPEKVLQPSEEISTDTIEAESHKYSDMMDAALGEVSGPMGNAASTQTIASPPDDTVATSVTAGPLGNAAPVTGSVTGGADLPPVVSVTSPTLGENPAVVAAPQVATNPEINGVPEMNFTPPADAEILPPPPAPVMDIGAPGSMPPETVPTPTVPASNPAATATVVPTTPDPAANPGAFQIPGM